MSTAATALLPLAGVLLLSVASPGPNFVVVTSTALTQRRAGVMTALASPPRPAVGPRSRSAA